MIDRSVFVFVCSGCVVFCPETMRSCLYFFWMELPFGVWLRGWVHSISTFATRDWKNRMDGIFNTVSCRTHGPHMSLHGPTCHYMVPPVIVCGFFFFFFSDLSYPETDRRRGPWRSSAPLAGGAVGRLISQRCFPLILFLCGQELANPHTPPILPRTCV